MAVALLASHGAFAASQSAAGIFAALITFDHLTISDLI
jgi:hypothetical protein